MLINAHSLTTPYRYHEAETSIHDRNLRKQEVVENYLESDLELLGLTGVEDKLQDGVRNTLELLRNAGLRIWMLTGNTWSHSSYEKLNTDSRLHLRNIGDKIETATCIAVSSKLVSRNQNIHQISKRLYSPHLCVLCYKRYNGINQCCASYSENAHGSPRRT